MPGNTYMYKDGASEALVTYNKNVWLELIASASTAVNMIEIFDSTGNTALIGYGASPGEVPLFQITPGGNGLATVRIDVGTRLTIRPLVNPVDGTEFVINFYD
jgi:hypothetical protein